jgi:CheY-like chemotaxis protein
VVYRLTSLDLNHGLQPMPALGRLQDEVGIHSRRPAPHRDILFSPRIDSRLETAPVLSLQQSDYTIVFKLLADRPHQNRAHQTPPSDWKVEIKPKILAWISQGHGWAFVFGLVPETSLVSYNAGVSAVPNPATSKILIVDDDEGVTQTFASMLRLEGYHVRTAVNAENGLLVAEESHPDAIILDLRMPVVDGLGFLRRLRATDEQRSTPVAIVTGDYFIEDEVSSELRQLGAELRFKPMWLEDLVGLARNLLGATP